MSGTELADEESESLPERFGRHRVVRLLGRGAMGSVYEAVHEELDKRVAIKTMHGPDVDHPERKERFLREGKAASKVHHPHAIDMYDVGVEGKTAFLVMEFLDGEDLEAMLRRAGALPVETTLDLLLPVFAAVSAAHDVGVVHRDLKPANIFLARSSEGVHPKVVDFGISKLQGDGLALTASTAIMGTPYYLAPEQLEGARFADARSDQWALSVILYECLTGRRPFEGDSLITLLWQIGQGELKPLRAHRPETPAGLEAVVLRGLSRKPDGRHASVRAMGAALLPYASAEARARWTRTFGTSVLASTPVVPLELDATLPPMRSDSAPRITPVGMSGPSLLNESVREVPPAETNSEVPAAPSPRSRRGLLSVVSGVALGVFAVTGFALSRRAPAPQTATQAAVTALPAPAANEAPPRAPEAAPPPAVAPPAPVAPNNVPVVAAVDAGAPRVTAESAEEEPGRRGRRHRSRRSLEGANDAPHAATTMVNGAPVLPVFPQ